MLRFFGKFPFLKKMVENLYKKETTLTNIEDQIIDLYTHRRKSFYQALILEYVARIVGAFEFYFIMQAISVDIDLFSSIYISAASSLIANLFFFIPLQLGTREGSLWLVYDSLKFTPALGVFVSFVTRIREFFWILIGLILLRISAISFGIIFLISSRPSLLKLSVLLSFIVLETCLAIALEPLTSTS